MGMEHLSALPFPITPVSMIAFRTSGMRTAVGRDASLDEDSLFAMVSAGS